ncbi:hypothetical protein [Pseudoteredinibacter isoporae]
MPLIVLLPLVAGGAGFGLGMLTSKHIGQGITLAVAGGIAYVSYKELAS